MTPSLFPATAAEEVEAVETIHPKSHLHNSNEILLPDLIDQIATDDPSAVWIEYPTLATSYSHNNNPANIGNNINGNNSNNINGHDTHVNGNDDSNSYAKITYAQFANAVNGLASWIDSALGRDAEKNGNGIGNGKGDGEGEGRREGEGETLCYIGPNDPLYGILIVAAVKAGCKVS